MTLFTVDSQQITTLCRNLWISCGDDTRGWKLVQGSVLVMS